MLNYRFLPSDEWTKLQVQFDEQQVPPLVPELAKVAVAEDGEKIVAFLVVQLRKHIEPLWIHPEYRNHVHHRPDYSILVDMLGRQQVYVFADSPARARTCERNGMKKMPYEVWYKE